MRRARLINGGASLRTATRTRVCRDRDDPTHYMEILEFDSYDDAMVNSELAVTNATHEAFVPLCTDGPRVSISMLSGRGHGNYENRVRPTWSAQPAWSR